MDKYVDCYTNKPPSNADLAKLLELCPFTQTFNMALTVRNYLEYSDQVGWTEKQLMQAILLLLKQQKPNPHVKLNVKKGDFSSSSWHW